MTIAIPTPAGDNELFPWEEAHDGGIVRAFRGCNAWIVDEPVPGAGDYEAIRIEIWGRQRLDRVERYVHIANAGAITPAQARTLAEALRQASYEAEFLDTMDGAMRP